MKTSTAVTYHVPARSFEHRDPTAPNPTWIFARDANAMSQSIVLTAAPGPR